MTRTTILRFIVAATASMLAALLSPTPEPRVQDAELYAWLSQARAPVPEAPGILLVETDPDQSLRAGESEDRVEMLLAMRELGARGALILVSMEPAAGTTSEVSKRRIKRRIDEEFSVIQSNISTLFDGIRLGSIRPKDGGFFVDKLIDLVGESGERLSTFLLEGREDELLRLEQARYAFGIESLAYNLADLGLEVPNHPNTLYLSERPVHADGSLPFKRIDSDAIAEYASLDKALIEAISGLDRAGYLSGVDPAAYPPALYDNAQALRNDLMLKKGDGAAWREARNAYLSSVGLVLSGKIERKLLAGYKEVLASEKLDEAGMAQVAMLVGAVRIAFATAEDSYQKLDGLRSNLAASIKDSYCIVATAPEQDRLPSYIWQKPTEAEKSACVLNASLSARWVIVPTGWKAKVAVFLAGLAAAAALAALGPAASLVTGAVVAATAFGAAAWLFIAHGIWFHPAHATLGVAAAATFSILALYAGIYRISVVKREPGGIQAGPGRSQKFAVLALRQISEPDPHDGGRDSNGRDPALALVEFHRLASKEIGTRGGQLLGSDGTILLAGFSTAVSACSAAMSIIDAAIARGEDWRCGLDSGACGISRSDEALCAASGRPVVYARILSGLAVKYGGNILATGVVVREAGNNWVAKRLDVLVEKTSGDEEPFFSLTSRR